MAFDRFLIAPFNTGLQTDLKPFLVLDDAFTLLQNAYVFRGRVRKRFGSLQMKSSVLGSRLRVQIGTTDGSGNLSFTNLPGNTLNAGSLFSVGISQFTVTAVPASVGTDATLSTAPVGMGTVKLASTGPNVYQFEITGSDATLASTQVFWYPALPVMGICQYESGAINNHPTYAFDTQFAYVYSGTGWARSGTAQWHGTTTNFFWTDNWQGTPGTPILFVTNFNATLGSSAPAATDDPIWSFNGTTWTSHPGSSTSNGFFFLPGGGAVGGGPFVQTARIVVPFKNRLVLLNTVENNNSSTTGSGTATSYTNRCRYSFNGSPFAVNAWYEPNQSDSSGNVGAGAGFIDATTEEQIISSEFIKDRLIVYFERSTWELAYTGNEVLPFVWQKINTELGSQSTFSTVPFDKEILTVGNTGIHACNGANVVRIDNKIPEEIFDSFETANNATVRTFGIRDYFDELVYWTFVETTATATQAFPNQILVYNYKNASWALFDDCFTAFGYFEQQTDLTWADTFPLTWQNITGTWNDNIDHANQRQIVAGTPEGFVLRLASGIARNAASMQITNITFNGNGTLNLTIYNHNFSNDSQEGGTTNADYVLIENVFADSTTTLVLNGSIWQVTFIDVNTIQINTNDNPSGAPPILTGEYYGAGTCARVSNIELETKQFNPYMKDDRNLYLHKIDFAVQKTGQVIQNEDGTYTITGGQITVDYFPSSTQLSMIDQGELTNTIMGTSVLETTPYNPSLYPLEQYQDRLWHPVYFQTTGNCVQIYMYMTEEQMVTPSISLSDFELEGMVIFTRATADRMA